jgi:hypothetical protein
LSGAHHPKARLHATVRRACSAHHALTGSMELHAAMQGAPEPLNAFSLLPPGCERQRSQDEVRHT